MKLKFLLAELEAIKAEHGDDVECCLQDGDIAHESFFVVPEEYIKDDGGWCVNIRSWPY